MTGGNRRRKPHRPLNGCVPRDRHLVHPARARRTPGLEREVHRDAVVIEQEGHSGELHRGGRCDLEPAVRRSGVRVVPVRVGIAVEGLARGEGAAVGVRRRGGRDRPRRPRVRATVVQPELGEMVEGRQPSRPWVDERLRIDDAARRLDDGDWVHVTTRRRGVVPLPVGGARPRQARPCREGREPEERGRRHRRWRWRRGT
jgi:hypothetical protein